MNYIKKVFRDKDNNVVFNNIIWSLIIKGIALIISVFSMNAYLTYFSESSYLGVWLTIVSIINWILTFDLGIGNGLRNYVTKSIATGKHKDIKKYISSAYVSLGTISFLGLVIFSILSYTLDWNSILNVSEMMLSGDLLANIMAISFANIFIRFFLNLITSILYALQKTFVINLIALLTNSTLLLYLVLINPISDLNAIYSLSFVHLFISNIPLFIATIIIFATSLKEDKPAMKYYDSASAKRVLGLGGFFFVAQIEMLLMNATNEFIINNLYGAVRVVDYQIYFKVFSIASMIFAIIIQPIWSAITKCVGENNYTKIKSYSRIIKIIALLGSISCFIVMFFLEPIIHVWLGEKAIEVTFKNAFIFALYISSTMFMNSATCIANGFGKIKTQLVYMFIAVILKMVFSFTICVEWSQIIFITAVLQFGMYFVQNIVNKKLIKDLENNKI